MLSFVNNMCTHVHDRMGLCVYVCLYIYIADDLICNVNDI